MNVQAKPSVGGAQRLLPFERVALVLQGGGALGAYQAGVYEALAESDEAKIAAIFAGSPNHWRVCESDFAVSCKIVLLDGTNAFAAARANWEM